MSIRTFLITPTKHVRLEIVRYSRERQCQQLNGVGQGGACFARLAVYEGPSYDPLADEIREKWRERRAMWPERCDRCGTQFYDSDHGLGTHEAKVYANPDNTWCGTLNEAPVGALWWAIWMDGFQRHQLEHVLVVKTPGGDWTPDSRASNCTRPEDIEHWCWVLHGPIENVTADKSGNTCAAGAGSILMGSYHGFLRNGELVNA